MHCDRLGDRGRSGAVNSRSPEATAVLVEPKQTLGPEIAD
jgi:hypothetical protein